MNSYDVKFENRTVGSVSVVREGLYYRFSCQCNLTNAAVYRLVVSCNGRTTDIGICVPQVGGFGLQKRIPVKRVGEDRMQFHILPHDQVVPDTRVIVNPNTAFAFISELHRGSLRIEGGCYEILLTGKITENAL